MSLDAFRPQLLVNSARSMMNVPRFDLVGTWSRSAAFLGRQALELALARLWSTAAPGTETTSMRAQLICLPFYVDEDLARRVRYTWHALSRACHHQAYELPPTAQELAGWIAEVELLVQTMDR